MPQTLDGTTTWCSASGRHSASALGGGTGRTRRGMAALAVAGTALGCSGDVREACPSFAAGAQEPVDVQTSATLLRGGANIAQLIVDDSGLYWFDEQATIWSLPR